MKRCNIGWLIAVVLCMLGVASPAGAQSTFQDCINEQFDDVFGATTPDCENGSRSPHVNFESYIDKVFACIQQYFGSDPLRWTPPSNPAEDPVVMAVCRYFQTFAPGGKCDPYSSCEQLIIAVQDRFHRGLTAAQICAIRSCSGCTISGCPTSGYPALTCGREDSPCTDKPYCANLRDNVARRLLCYFQTHSCPGTPADIDQILADTACETYKSSAAGGCAGTDSNGCIDIIKCFLSTYPRWELTPERVKKLVECSGCSDLCTWVCPTGSSCAIFRVNSEPLCQLRCNEPSASFCEDLQTVIAIAEGCAAKNGCLVDGTHLTPACYAQIIVDFVNTCYPGISCYQIYQCVHGLSMSQWLGPTEHQTIFASTTNCTLTPTCEWADLDRADGKNFADLDIAIWIAMMHGGPPSGWEAFVVSWLELPSGGGFCLAGECKDIQPHLQASLGEEIGFPILPAAFEARGCKMDQVTFVGDGDPEDQDTGNDCGGTGTPKSPNPVAMAYGSKVESTVDISVALPGRPFNVTRSYISREYAGTPSVGQNWMMSTLTVLDETKSSGATTSLIMYGPSVDDKRVYTLDGTTWSSDTWKTGGAGQQFFKYEASLSVDGATYPVWRLHTPGGGTLDFVAKGSTPSPLDGRLIQEADEYGRRVLYKYTIFTNPSSQQYAKLTWISVGMYGSENTANARAKLVFEWYSTTSSTSPVNGKLRSIKSFRGTTLVEQADYLYKDATDATQSSYSSDLGTNGDLIQVTHHTLMDNAVWHTTVTQYRYHSGGSGDNSTRLLTKGRPHQLKMVIQPEQIEYASQHRASGGTATAILDTATAIRALADSATAFTDTGSVNRPVVDLAAKVIGYMSASGTGSWAAQVQFIQAACGCGGGATQGVRETYTYTGDVVASGKKYSSSVITEAALNSSGSYDDFRATHYNIEYLGFDAADPTNKPGVAYLTSKAIVELTSGSRTWVQGYKHADGTGSEPRGALVREYSPSAISSYSPGTSSAAASFTVSSSAGLVHAYAYTADGRLKERRVGSGDGAASTYALVEETEYPTSASTSERTYLPHKIKRYRVAGSASAGDIEETTLAYTFHDANSTTERLASVSATSEAEATGENPPNGTPTYTSAELYDDKGQNTWTKAPDYALIKRVFDGATGGMTSITTNADPSTLSGSSFGGITTTGWGNTDGGSTRLPGGELAASFTYDNLGRQVSATSVGGVVRYTRREALVLAEQPNQLYYAVLSLPARTSGGDYEGPAIRTWYTAGGKEISSQGFVATYPVGQPWSYSLGAQLSKSFAEHTLSGLVVNAKVWTSIAGSGYRSTDQYSTTAYEYDSRGRATTVTAPNNTVTVRVYDVLDRVTKVQVGTTSATPVDVAEYYYDSAGAASQGVGDGNLTYIRQTVRVVGGTPEVRNLVRTYDSRNRLIKIEGPTSPYSATAYDNLDRVSQQALFTSNSSGSAFLAYAGQASVIDAASVADRVAFSRTTYNQRGLPFRRETAIDPTNLSTPGYLATNSWFDPNGRLAGSGSPNSPFTKRAYDGHGRIVKHYVTDRGGFPDSTTLGGDQVVEQTESTYNSVGLLEAVLRRRRLHDTTATGALSNSTSVATYLGYGYDGLDRPSKTVNFGTGSTGTADNIFKNASSAPAWPTSSIPSEALVTETTYNNRGLVDTVQDAEGRKTKFLYDEAGRRIATVENSASGLTFSWDATNGRWQTSGLSSADVNRVTSTVYDPVGRASKLVAHAPNGSGGETVQVTTYTYGVDSSFSSDIASMDLLRQVAYPDTKTVNYRYNRLGELKALIDQNGTQHDYTRDAAGRVTLDSATIASGSPIDNAILGIKIQYDDAGRVRNAWSTSDAAGTSIVNAVRYDYNGLWQITRVYQNHAGDVSIDGSGNPAGSTRMARYSYGQSSAASNNYSRPVSLFYPTQSRQTLSYGASTTLSSRISRPYAITFHNGASGSAAFTFLSVAQEYIGLDMVASMELPLASILLDRTFSHEGKRRTDGLTSQAAGVYPGLDRFGRVQRQAWIDAYYMDQHASSTTLPAVPPIVEEVYAYDRNSNRTGRYDARPGVAAAARDNEYSYDQLNRLTEAKAGLRSNSTTWTPASGGQQWILDMLGNWTSVRTDLTGNGAYTDSGDLLDQRSSGAVNHYTDRTINGGTSQPFAYDDAGNMTEQWVVPGDTRHVYVHDAWNRLVKVTAVAGSASVDLLRNQYNALHWRVVKEDSTAVPPDTPNRRVVMYYSASWQLLEEHIDEDYLTSSGVDRIYQQFWGMNYIDQPVMRRMITPSDMDVGTYWFHLTDVQHSTIAMCDAYGTNIVERVTYDAYGRAHHHWNEDFNGDGSADALDFDMIEYKLDTDITASGYDARLDLNRDGVIDAYDEACGQPWYRNALPAASLSYQGHDGGTNEPYLVDGPSNPVGYCGYIFNGPATELYTVRYRHYSPELGRWLERDPAGYVEGASLYGYVLGMPMGRSDPLGLAGWVGGLFDAIWRKIAPHEPTPQEVIQQIPETVGTAVSNAVPAMLEESLRNQVLHGGTCNARLMQGFRQEENIARATNEPTNVANGIYLGLLNAAGLDTGVRAGSGFDTATMRPVAGVDRVSDGALFIANVASTAAGGVAVTRAFVAEAAAASAIATPAACTPKPPCGVGSANPAGAAEIAASKVAGQGTYSDLLQSARYLKQSGLDAAARREILSSFEKGTIQFEQLGSNEAAYRFFSDPVRARGSYLTSTFTTDPVGTLALPPGNSGIMFQQWTIPQGTGVIRGIAAPNFGLPGGGSQIFITNPSVLRPVPLLGN